MSTNSILGSEILGQNLGPCNIYFDTESGGDNIYLGKTDATTIRSTKEKTDLVTSQDGSIRSDAVITGESWEVEFGMAQPTLERWEAIDETIKLKRSGQTITGATFSSGIGNGDLDNAKRMRIVRIRNGVDSTNPLDSITFYKARVTPSVEMTFDAGTQRFASTMAFCYKDPSKLDSSGAPTFGYIGVI